MNKSEMFMSKYPFLQFIFKKDMPKRLGGFVSNDTIYINDNKTDKEKTQTIAEELAHYDTTVGNIIGQSTTTDVKQELQARGRSYKMMVSLDDLISCYNLGLREPWEIADNLDCETDFLWKSIDYYRTKNGVYFKYDGYSFNLNHGLNIRKL